MAKKQKWIIQYNDGTEISFDGTAKEAYEEGLKKSGQFACIPKKDAKNMKEGA